MIELQNLTVKNFMSVGNATQAINFDRKDLTLVLGENLDMGGDGSRNGTGKTTIINALSYALFGNALTNIRKDNLINKTNSKNMLVSLDFKINNVQYRVERGRKPNVLKFYVEDSEHTDDNDAQGDSRETQSEIERKLGLSHDMFKHILALNTYTEPFLSLKNNDQRALIEQLLGITQLSDRAERIKELLKETKDSIQQEDFRIKALQEANVRVAEQIKSLKKRKTLWLKKQSEDCDELVQAISSLEHIDIEQEVQNHRALSDFYSTQTQINNTKKEIQQLDTATSRLEKEVVQIEKDIDALEANKCHACGQELHDHKHKQDQILKDKQLKLESIAKTLEENSIECSELENELEDLGELGSAPKVFYDNIEEALNHQNSVKTLHSNLETRQNDTDPYQEQIDDMEKTVLQEISYEELNRLTRIQEHQDFLLKLLTSKDSFIRKRIIEQNLSYLNNRLTYYLDRIGLPHQVIFQNDLSVEITELGRDLDFDNLSRGERNRLILSMSWAFRDVWESLYSPINVLFIDELVDSGMDTQGVESSLALLKKMSRERNKSVWLVSHKDELAGRVENILKVVKENGFTNYNTDVDLV